MFENREIFAEKYEGEGVSERGSFGEKGGI